MLGPEMTLGGTASVTRGFLGRLDGYTKRLKRIKSALPQKSDESRHGTVGSRFPFKYDSVKSSILGNQSVRITRRERKVVRAQDIFKDPPERQVKSISRLNTSYCWF